MNPTKSILVSEGQNKNGFFAISYRSQTFNDLEFYLQNMHGITLNRVEPENFDAMPDKDDYNFINLVTQQTSRRTLCEKMDQYSVSRFSFITDITNVSDVNCIGIGSFLYPSVICYPNASVGKDSLIHSLTICSHACTVGVGCFFSGNVLLLGSCQIGDFCWFGARSMIFEKIRVPDNTWVAATRIIRSSKEF